ncbi:hypothetical protein F4811DRAFT_554011 [Daldinia bambusicola]|nr:hypothetical protein F4811DRAFT_554011 [Daldinia bambusicola]
MAPPHQTPQSGAQRQQGLPGADTPEIGALRRASSFRGGSRRGRGRGRPGGRGGNRGGNRNSQLPLSASAGVLGRPGQATTLPPTFQQPGISLPFGTGSQHRPSGSISSRQLSAGLATGGPPSSQPTTGYSTMTASRTPRLSIADHPNPLRSHPTQEYLDVLATGSQEALEKYIPGPLRHLQPTTNLPSPPSTAAHQPGVLKASSRALLPVPESSGATTSSVTASASGVIPRFRAENINPYLSDVDLGRKHRDSLEISSVKKVPKRTPPRAKVKFSMDASNIDQTIPELPEQMPESARENNDNNNNNNNTGQKAPALDRPLDRTLDRPLLPRPPAQQLPKQTFPSMGNIPSVDLSRAQQLPQQLSQQIPQPTPRQMPSYRAEKRSGIPKSRTFNVLSSLTSSFSRASLSDKNNSNNNSNNNRSNLRRQIGPPIMAPTPTAPFDGTGTGNGNGNTSLTEGNNNNNNNNNSSSSSAAITTPTLVASSSTPSSATAVPTIPVHRNPRMVYAAESPSYWTGRFMAMQDKLRNENLRGQNLHTITAAISEQQQQAAAAITQPSGSGDDAFPTSYSMADMPGVTAQLLSGEAVAAVQAASAMTDDDQRIRRVFRHLEAQCANRSALDSMHEFQQDYARLVGKKGLLPPGSAWDDYGNHSNIGDGAGDDNKDKDKDQDKDKKAGGGGGGGGGGGQGWVGRIFSGSSSGSNGKKK